MPNNQLKKLVSQLKNISQNPTQISAIVSIIWFIPGLALFWSILINPLQYRIHQDLSDSDLNKIEKIVDRKISRNTDLVNILLFVLTALPIVGNFYFWLLYKSVREGIIQDSLNELKPKLLEELKPKIEQEVNKDLPNELNKILQQDNTILNGIIAVLDSENLNKSIKSKLLTFLDLSDSDIKNKFIEIMKDDSIQTIIAQNISKVIMNDIQNIETKINALSDKIDTNKKGIIDSIKVNRKSINEKPNEKEIVERIKQELNNFIDKLKEDFEYNPKRADQYKDEADKLFAQGNYLSAITRYQWASAYDPDNPYFWYKIAESHRQLKEYKSAINYFNEVIKLDEKENEYPTAHYYKAACHALEKQEGEAIESLKKAISLNSDEFKEKAKDYKAFDLIKEPYYRACFYALIDDTTNAVEELKKAIDKNPEYKEKAKTESAFNSIRDNEEFKTLIE